MSDLGPLGQVTCVRGESFMVAQPSGDIARGTDQGLYVRDTRFLDRFELHVGGQAPRHLSAATVGDRAVFHAYLPPSSDVEVDPTIAVTRRRLVDGGLREEIEVSNAGSEDVQLDVTLRVGSDFAYVFDVKHGRAIAPATPEQDGEVLVFGRDGGPERTRVSMAGPATVDDDRLTLPVTIPAGGSHTVVVEVVVDDVHGTTAPDPRAVGTTTWQVAAGTGAASTIRCSDRRFARLVRQSVLDLRSLVLPDPLAPDDCFAAAGSPWFLTLFGRDSIWAAFMALPQEPQLARGTLFVLARRQGTRIDDETEEQPGKILHEVRRGGLADRGDLPPVYYGTVDATPLFVVLAHEAWRWGAISETDLAALLPHVEAALGWMRDHADPDGDGFLEYVQHGARGLANQGWKDSHDGLRFADGTIARAPLALSEVQGYAHDAAVRGAQLLEHVGRPEDAAAWRTWAADLRERFRATFWVSDERGRYPAAALDHAKRPVDGVASNMGHLLMSGLLDNDEVALVAARLGAPDLASGWGLRTLSARSGGYNPFSYHCGSVWPHDTAIAVWGLARAGRAAEATTLLRGLVRAAPTFEARLPELFSGIGADASPTPVPYPTACRPQAWAAGGALLMARAAAGLEADVPNRRIVVHPMSPAPFERLELRDLPVAGGTLDLVLRGDRVSVDVHDTDLDVLVVAASRDPHRRVGGEI